MNETQTEDAEAVVALYNTPSKYMPGRTEEKHEHQLG